MVDQLLGNLVRLVEIVALAVQQRAVQPLGCIAENPSESGRGLLAARSANKLSFHRVPAYLRGQASGWVPSCGHVRNRTLRRVAASVKFCSSTPLGVLRVLFRRAWRRVLGDAGFRSVAGDASWRGCSKRWGTLESSSAGCCRCRCRSGGFDPASLDVAGDGRRRPCSSAGEAGLGLGDWSRVDVGIVATAISSECGARSN